MWFRRVQAFGKEGASFQAELFVITMIIQIVRLYADSRWLPKSIRISSLSKRRKLPTEWNAIKVEWGSDATYVELSRKTLGLESSPGKQKTVAGSKGGRRPKSVRPTFTKLVETQIKSGIEGIENASRQTGLSVSTIQRRLRNMNTSYKEIVEQVRFAHAQKLLTDTQLSIAEVAGQLSYKHQANFARAFKKLSGVSPGEYRSATHYD